MQKDTERLHAAFNAVLDFKPIPFDEKVFRIYPKLLPPVTFYDRHLDKRLRLKKVTLVPLLVNYLDQVARTAFANNIVHLPSKNFPTMGFNITGLDRTSDAREIGQKYQVETSFTAACVASMLLLHPNSPTWASAFRMTQYRSVRRLDYMALNDDFAPEFLDPYQEGIGFDSTMIGKDVWYSMDESTRDIIFKAKGRFPLLAVWQMFYVRREARRALKRMNYLATLDPFPMPTFSTLTPPYVPPDTGLPYQPDAFYTAWGISVTDFVQNSSANVPIDSTSVPATVSGRQSLRRSSRLSRKDRSNTLTHPNVMGKIGPKQIHKIAEAAINHSPRITGWTNATAPSGPHVADSDEDMATAIVQHAWSVAVKRDSTFIVLHCGDYERIAFRHRSSGTMFLSDLIETRKCSDPGYGAIHVGLFISIIKDVLDRMPQIVDQDTKDCTRKRKRSTLEPREIRKRPRTRAAVADADAGKKNFQAISTEVARRPLALLRIQHSHYNSAVPTSFLRYDHLKDMKDRTVYTPEEYFCITLTAPLGFGATGDAHEGFIDLRGPAGDTLSLANVVVKFAFEPDERQRLRHESKVYKYLRSSNVTVGIPHFFGLFKDLEGDTLALVMTNVGTPLSHRKPPGLSGQDVLPIPVSQSERTQFITILESIHAVGVRHRDIRGANLVVNDDGVANIIDFDRASLKSRRETLEREMNHLLETLDSIEYTGVGIEFITRGTFRESELASVRKGNIKTREERDEDSECTPWTMRSFSGEPLTEEEFHLDDDRESDSGSERTATATSK